MSFKNLYVIFAACGRSALIWDSSTATDYQQGLEKSIPDTPKGQTPIHLRDMQLFADNRQVVYPWEKDVGIRKDQANQPS